METAKLFIEQLKHKQLTTIYQLREGDRFYFKSDKKRIVWQVLPRPAQKKTWKYGGHTWAADIQVKNDLGQTKYCVHRTEVVFLRHTSE